MHRLSLTAFLIFATLTAGAQSTTFVDVLEKEVKGQGKVEVESDARLDSLIGHCAQSVLEGQLKATGYRIQIFAGNNTREARAKAQQAEAFIREKYPDLPVYTVFRSPRWLCTAGDFLYYEDAYDMMRKIKNETDYKGAIILRNQEINISEEEETEVK